MKKQLIGLGVAALMFGGVASAGATILTGGSNLLTSSDLDYIESNIGNGSELEFSNIFSSVYNTGLNTLKDASAFHAAVDGQGATVTVYSILDTSGNSFIIGGYNDESWMSTGGYDYDNSPEPRANFLFNLTSGFTLTQKTVPNGKYSAYHKIDYYATFGGGNDLYLGHNAYHGYDGYAYQHGYGDEGTDTGGITILGTTGVAKFDVLAMEVFSLSADTTPPTPTPEPATMLLFGTGLIGLVGSRIRRKKQQ